MDRVEAAPARSPADVAEPVAGADVARPAPRSARPTPAPAPAPGAATALLRPPAPRPRPAVPALLAHLASRDRDLLGLLPPSAYRRGVGRLGYSRRAILLINEPAAVREVMVERADELPKNDLFAGALAPLVRDSVFTSADATWHAQRRLIDPALAHAQVRRAFPVMQAATADAEARIDADAAAGRPVALDAAMSRVTADVIFRAIFSESLESEAAREIFDAFADYQASVAHVDAARLILSRPFAPTPVSPACRAACERIRGRLRAWVAARMRAAEAGETRPDIVGALIAAEDPDTGRRFDVEELVDQIGVFFLAGHETTAGALTWAIWMLARAPEEAEAIRAEAASVGTEGLDQVKRLHRARAAFREAMRLYPPLPFLPRVAPRATNVGGARVPAGAMLMVAPWTLHRCVDLWADADRFDPSRFLGAREKAIEPGAYLPFGLGPRLCVGAAFATVEATLILARLVARYDWQAVAPGRARPRVRLTLRPAEPLAMRVARR